MADNSVFGDDSLFDEFEKEQEPSDKILKQTILNDQRLKQARAIDDGSDSAFSAEFTVGSSSSTEEESDSDGFIGNEDSDHGGGVTGTSDTLHQMTAKSTIKEHQSSNKKAATDEDKYLEMKQRIEELTKDNLALRKQCKVVSVDRVTDEEGPAIQVMYMNHAVSRKYKSEIEDFIFHLLQNDNREETLPYLHLRPNAVCFSDKGEKMLMPNDKTRLIQASTGIGCGHYYRDFVMDAMGWPLIEYNPALTDGWNVPVYEQCYTQSIPYGEDEEEDLKPVKKKRAKAACFNCGGEHSLRECKQQHDQRNISKNRQEFMANNSPANQGMKMQRYILPEKSGNRAQCKAGQISDDLRDALGLDKKQLPPYIYQMRVMGYPPGWLEETQVFTSGVAMFDKHGKEVTNENEAGEDGEIDLNAPEQKRYDTELLVKYPGFNVEPEKGTLDEARNLGMPPMQPAHSFEAFKLFLEPAQTPSKGSSKSRKRRSELEDYPGSGKRNRADENGKSDMDLADSGDDSMAPDSSQESQPGDLDASSQEDGEIVDEDFIPPVPPTPEPPPLPPGTPPVTPQPDSTPGRRDETFKTPHPPTPNTMASQVTPTRIPLPQATPPNHSLQQQFTDKINSELASQRTNNDDGKKSSPAVTTDVDSTPLTPNGVVLRSPNTSCGSMSSSFGTPVLERSLSMGSNTPSSAVPTGKGLPDANNFALGITEHLPFENLPKATGKYQQMKKVLDKQRKNKK